MGGCTTQRRGNPMTDLYITGFFFLALYMATLLIEKYVLPPDKKRDDNE
jgi:hypothetical protein